MPQGCPTFVFATTSNDSKLLVKKTTLYQERDEEKRKIYRRVLEKRDSRKLVFMDETGMDTFLYRPYARARRGITVTIDIAGQHFQRTSIIAGLCQNRAMAPMYFDGYCNTELVWTWVQEVLLPILKSGMTVIWDNASFHKSSEIEECLAEVGCRVLFLAPYSPDLNPIEQFWAKMKWALTSLIRLGQTLEASLHAFFQNTTF
jgi:transposase